MNTIDTPLVVEKSKAFLFTCEEKVNNLKKTFAFTFRKKKEIAFIRF